jgi:Fe-S oxidoreductase
MTRVKEELIEAGHVPTELQEALENSQRYGNPLGKPRRQRADWIKDLDFPVPIMRQLDRPVEVLWFVGDYASFNPRVKKIGLTLARLLHLLGIDFAILRPK